MLGPSDRAWVKGVLDQLRPNYRSFHLLVPTETDCTVCGYDEFTDSALDSACTTCNGLGRTVTWTALEVKGRVQHYDFVKLSAAGLPPGIEIGDSVAYVSPEVKDAVLDLRESPRGYVYLDSDTYRPWSVQPTGVGHADEWRVELKRTNVDARADGY
jgi:hypothetical protein